MKTLTSSLVQLGSLMNSLSGLGDVKKHLFRATREMLLAFGQILEMVDEYTSNQFPGHDQKQTLQMILDYSRKRLRQVVNQLPKTDEDEFRKIHRKVMVSILDVLEREMKKNSRGTTPKAKMKSEVFEAIRNVLLKEMYEQEKGLEKEIEESDE